MKIDERRSAAAHLDGGLDLVLPEAEAAFAEQVTVRGISPKAVEAEPDSWIVLALERWLHNDLDGASHWLDRLTAMEDAGDRTDEALCARSGCVRLIRARMVLGQSDAAAQAYRDATKVFAGSPADLSTLRQMAASVGVPGA